MTDARPIDLVDQGCTGLASEGAHHWLLFDGGYGCDRCDGWVSLTTQRVTILDPLPTHFPAFHRDDAPGIEYGPKVAVPEEPKTDLDVDVMALLLPIAGQVNFAQLEQTARDVIARVRAEQ